MEYARINATMPVKILKQVDAYAEQMQEDRSTAIRQLIARALLEERKKTVAEAFRKHKLTLREAAEGLGVDYWTLQEILEKEGVPITDLTRAEVEEEKLAIEKIAKQMKKRKK